MSVERFFIQDKNGRALEIQVGSKAAQVITLSDKDIMLSSAGQIITVTASAEGALSVQSSNPNICTASISNGTITITAASPLPAEGTATITVTAAATEIYAKATATISVEVGVSLVVITTDDERLFLCPVTLTDGAHTYTGTFNLSGQATVKVNYVGTYMATSEGKTVGSVVVEALGETYYLDGTSIIYGFHVNGLESAPASMVSYHVQYDGKNVKNYDYATAAVNLSTGVMNPGGWNLTDDFFIPRSCMLKYDGTVDYYLDENDETKKEDGTASDVANANYDGNAMMEWGRDGKKIWLKIVPDATPTDGATFYVANKQQMDEGFRDLPFYDCDGNEGEHFYTAKYNGALVSNKLRSISGLTPMNSQTGTNEITYATANNVNGKTEWYTEVLADRFLINVLLLMIGGSCNTQAVFGQGYTTGGSSTSSLAATGTLNGKGQWYGSTVNNNKAYGVKVFGMEHWWGNIWRRIAGYVNISGTVKYKLTYSTADGTTVDGYSTNGNGYKTVANGTPGGTNGGYANVAVFNEDGIFLKTASGSESTYYTDGLWFNNGQSNYALVGGYCDFGALCGALCVTLYSAVSYASWSVGAALSCKPLAA